MYNICLGLGRLQIQFKKEVARRKWTADGKWRNQNVKVVTDGKNCNFLIKYDR